VNGYSGALTVTAKVWYQSLPPKWMAPMFEFHSPEIDSFKVMFDAADRSPVLVAERSIVANVSPVGINRLNSRDRIRIFPAIAPDGRVTIQADPSLPVQRVQVWDSMGRVVAELPAVSTLVLPERKGTYLIVVSTKRGKTVEKIVRP
jgi:hypothetical protein